MKKIINFFKFIFNLIVKLLKYFVKIIFTKQNLKKMIEISSKKWFWFLVLIYQDMMIVRTISANKDYGWFTNLFVPTLSNLEQTMLINFLGWLAWTIWVHKDTRNSKFFKIG